MEKFKTLIAIFTIILFSNCKGTDDSKKENTNDQVTKTDNTNVIPSPVVMTYEIIKTYPHDTSSYTEGLEWNDHILIESTGNYKESKLILLDSNMKVIQSPVKLNDNYFGEGATLFKDKIYQLTWKEHKVFVYQPKTLAKIGELDWPYEGWGMTHNDTAIILNTGGSSLYYIEPTTFKKLKTVDVFDNNGYVANVNELEYVDGKIFANVYLTDKILQIDPNTGQVKAIADLSNILSQVGVKNDPRSINQGNVLNGIAYNKKKGTFFITGKDWPVMIELKFNYVK